MRDCLHRVDAVYLVSRIQKSAKGIRDYQRFAKEASISMHSTWTPSATDKTNPKPPSPTNPGTPHHPHPKEHQVRYAVLRPSPCGIPHQPRVIFQLGWGGRKVSLQDGAMFLWILRVQKKSLVRHRISKKTLEKGRTLLFLDQKFLIQQCF